MHSFTKMMQSVITTVLLLTFLEAGVSAQDACQIDIDAAPESFNPPFLIRPKLREVLYPELRDGVRLLTVPSGTTLLAACPGRRNALALTNEKTAEVTCYDGQMIFSYELDSQAAKWEDMGCLRRPRASISTDRNSICGEEGTGYNIGWNVRTGLFVPLVYICFDVDKETTEFTFHRVQGRSIGVKSVDSSRPSFRPGNMFSLPVKTIYKKKSQIALFTDLLGTSEHLTGRGQHYLARGHMAPDSDFVYTAEQDATYYYGNVVPQWQAFNNGNWKRLEYAIRELAEKHETTLDIWTGTYGTLQMPDTNNNPVDMFLGLAEGKKLVPVPALMWKVIYNPVIRRALAVVSFNEVRGRGTSDDVSLMEPPCPDVCNQVPWIDWNTQDVNRGLTFCCHVRDLRSIIPSLPDLGKVALLEN